MTKLRIAIIDDEPLARARIRAFLAGHPGSEVTAEHGDGIQALEALRADPPDIAFLDVEMPGLKGTELLAELPEGARPVVIMTTAHEGFAVDAFALDVTDYLVKPFDQERFDAAMGRATERVRARRADSMDSRVEALLASALEPRPRHLVLRVDGRLVFQRPEEVVWVEAENNYCQVHLSAGRRILVRETLTSLEGRLAPWRFERVNRSALVNMDEVQELQPAQYGDYAVVLRTGVRLPLSRGLRGRLRGLLSSAP